MVQEHLSTFIPIHLSTAMLQQRTLLVFMETGACGEYKSKQHKLPGHSLIWVSLHSLNYPLTFHHRWLNQPSAGCTTWWEAINSCSLLMRWQNKCTHTLLCASVSNTLKCAHIWITQTDMSAYTSSYNWPHTNTHIQSQGMAWHAEWPSALSEGHVACVEFNEGTCTHPSTSLGELLPFGVVRY